MAQRKLSNERSLTIDDPSEMSAAAFLVALRRRARAVGQVLASAICLVFLMPGDRVAAEQTPLRIMPLGDSITQGAAGS